MDDGATNGYPAAVAKQFTKSCTVNAKVSSDGKLDDDQAREYCMDTLACIEQRLTIAEFVKTEQRLLTGEKNPGARVLLECQKNVVQRSGG